MNSERKPTRPNQDAKTQPIGPARKRRNRGDSKPEDRASASDITDATLLMQIADLCCEYWHDSPEGDAYVTMEVDGRKENHKVNSRRFKRLLTHAFYVDQHRVPSPTSVTSAIAAIEGEALFNGSKHEPCLRVAGDDTEIQIDLCDDQWRTVVVDGTGFRVEPTPSVRFIRHTAMQPLPEPTTADLNLLHKYLNVRDEDLPLILAWMLACLRPTGPYPVLVLFGEQGSAKSTTARVLRSLVDPNKSLIRSAPKSLQDLAIAANNGRVIALDNLSSLPASLSDGLCRLATGGGFSTRALYENDEEVIFDAQRPVILTGIEDVASRADLADRAIIVSLPTIDPNTRKSEKQLWEDFDRDRPAIFAGLLELLSACIRNLPTVTSTDLPRMADFAQWGMAAEAEMGLAPGEWMQHYQANIESTNASLLDDNPLLDVLREKLTKTIDIRTSGEWLETLDESAPESVRKQKSWPRTPRKLSGELRRLAPVMRRSGIQIDFETHSTEHRTQIAISIAPPGGDFCGVESEQTDSPTQMGLLPEADATELGGANHA